LKLKALRIKNIFLKVVLGKGRGLEPAPE